MATQWLDNFSAYGIDGQARMLNGSYAEIGGCFIVVDPDPTPGTDEPVLLVSSPANGIGVTRKVLTSSQATVGIAHRMWLNIIPIDTGDRPHCASFRDINNVVHLYVTVNPSGYLEVYRNDSGGVVLIAQSAGPVIVANAWQHVETKVLIHASAGSVECRIEDVAVINVSGIRTSSNIVGALVECSSVALANPSSGGTDDVSSYYKDLIVWDGSGAFNNNFFGPCFVHDCVPDADESFNWVASSGVTGWNLIDGAPPADDVDYVEAVSPPPPASVFNLSDLPPDAVIAKAVMTMVRAKKTDGGDGKLQVGLKSGASTGLGADRPITTAYTYWSDVFDTDPNGGIGWTVAAVNALDLQLNRTL